MCAWGADAGHLPTNPVRDVKAGRAQKGSGYYTWTVADVEQFLEHHGNGTKARLALGLLLFSGARRQDMVTFGKQHVRGGWIRYVPKKTLYKRRDVSQKPFLPVLEQIIASSPCGALTFLETTRSHLPRLGSGIGSGNAATRPAYSSARLTGSRRPAPRSLRRTARRQSNSWRCSTGRRSARPRSTPGRRIKSGWPARPWD